MPIPEDERRCPRCDEPHEEDQEYCLECGLRLPVRTGVVASLGAAWRRRAGWYPGDWVWPALLALLVAVVAGAVSALWLADRSSSAAETLVQTSPTAAVVTTTRTAPEPTAPSTTTTPTPAT